MMRKIQSENGFTLIELLVALVIFAFGILAVVKMQFIATNTDLTARYMSEGVVVAQSKIEELMGLNYDDGNLKDDNGDNSLTKGMGGTAGKTIEEDLAPTDFQDFSNPTYKIGWNVLYNTPYLNTTKTVRVIVKWEDRDIKKTFSLDMVKTDGG